MAADKKEGRTGLIVGAVLAVLAVLLLWPRDEPTTPAPMASASARAQPAPPKRRLLRGTMRGEQRIDLSEAKRTDAEGIGRIEGQVLSRGDERGVADARLVFDDGSLHNVKADGDGRFSFSPPKEGVYELALVEAEGFLPFAPEYGHSPMVFSARRGSGLSGARVLLTPAIDYTIRVVTPGQDPQPVAGAKVVALGGAAQDATLATTKRSWTTNADGVAIVHGRDHTLFEASHADYAAARGRLDFAAQVSKVITIALRDPSDALRREHTLFGTVTDDAGPVAGALVIAMYEADNPARTRSAMMPALRATTGVDGSFSFDEVIAGRYRLSASAAGYAPSLGTKVMVPNKGVDLTLAPGASLYGKVQSEAGEAVPSFVVVVRERIGPLRREVVVAEPTFDPDGEYAIPALPKGTFLVTVSAFGFAPSPEREITIAARDVEADFSLARGATITGTVIDAESKAPLEGAKVSLEGSFGGRRAVQLSSSSRSDASGRFTLRGVGAGPQSVLVAASEHHGRLMSLTVEAGGSRDITVELTRTEEGEEPRIELAGIGAVLSAKDDVLLIGRVVEGGGALEAGLGPDDAILAVDGIPVVELGFAGAIRKIRGPVGSIVRLTIKKAGTDAAATLDVVRRKIRG